MCVQFLSCKTISSWTWDQHGYYIRNQHDIRAASNSRKDAYYKHGGSNLKLSSQEKHLRALCFYVNLNYKTQYTAYKQTAEMEKSANSKNIVRISLYGIVRAAAFSSSTRCTYIKYFVFENMSKSLKKLKLETWFDGEYELSYM